ncbi:MAG TPA: sulfotransferase [Gaiellaceae bacterium]|nr:sulfotransferase [Gaiellaceae bacterium]
MAAGGPPLLVLGVRRSGTTLLRVMLDRNSRLAIPDESYFVPQLAARHRGPLAATAFLDDLRRISTLVDWGVDPERVAGRLRDGMPPGDAIAAVFETYAADRGKERWGDKTPLYMQYLALLERLFPTARFVHLVRDGREVALSFLSMPEGIVTRSWAHPTSAADVACQWRTEVGAARRLGARLGPGRYLEIRYEALVAEPERELAAICSFAGLSYEPEMLRHAEAADVAAKPHQRSLRRPLTPGIRDWRTEMAPADVAAFEDVAGELLAELGYELSTGPPRPPSPGARARLASYRARSWAWRTAGRGVQRSPLWRRRHPVLVRP